MFLRRYKVFGPSMEPEFGDGQYVLGENWTYKFREPGVGDLIIFQEPSNKILAIKKIDRLLPNGYFVTGINRNFSLDSRHYGLIPRKSIVAKAIMLR